MKISKITVARSVRLVLLLSALPLAFSGLAHSQVQEDTALEEIVVTAQKREESLRDVPLSVNAVSGDKLAEAGILRLDDLKAYVPNLQMTETGVANNIYIRGIGSGLNQGFEQSVSIYADGIYRGRGHQSRMPFLDLSRVEVLRGPQPILFGKNAVAGAVNMVSNVPGEQFEGMARLSYDLENQDMIGSAVVSGPVTDTFGARAALHFRDAGGFVNNLTLDRDEPKRDEFAARLTFQWQPSDALTARLRVEGGSYDTVGRQIEIFGETPTTAGPINGLTYAQAISGAPLPLLLYPTGLPQGTSATASNNVIDYLRSSNGDSSELSNLEAALTLEYELSGGLTLTSVTGYSTYDLDERCDCDFVGATVFNAGITEDYDQISQELRIASPADQRLSWLAGVFFQDYGLDETDYLYVPTSSLVVPVLARSFAANTALGGTPASRAALANFFANAANPRVFTQDSTLWSAFGQVTFQATEALKFTAGARFSDESKDGTRVTRLTSGLGGPALPGAVLPLFAQVLGIVPHSLAGSRSESSFSPLVNVQYNIADETLVYLSWARGYKSGGYDARSNKPPVAGGTPLTSGTFEFGDEEATTYEVGLKSALGQSAEINAAVFFTDYKDLQTSAFDGAIGFNVGSGDAEVKGVEVDARWRVTPRLMLSGSMAYLDFEWTRYFGQCYYGRAPLTSGSNAGNCDYAGFSNQLAPEFSGVVSADYSWPVGNDLMLTTTADLVYSAEYLQSLTLDPVTTQDAYFKLNARVALTDGDRRWEVALVGRNLTDETTVSYAGDTPLSSRLFGARSYYGFTDQPLGIALEGTIRF